MLVLMLCKESDCNYCWLSDVICKICPRCGSNKVYEVTPSSYIDKDGRILDIKEYEAHKSNINFTNIFNERIISLEYVNNNGILKTIRVPWCILEFINKRFRDNIWYDRDYALKLLYDNFNRYSKGTLYVYFGNILKCYKFTNFCDTKQGQFKIKSYS